MQIGTKLLITMIMLITASSLLFCQDSSAAKPDSSIVKAQILVEKTIKLIQENSFSATYNIQWEELIYNGSDYSYDYWDAYDWEEEDYFTEDMIDLMNKKLHYEGDADDVMTKWTTQKKDEIIIVKCNNKKKNVEMHVKISSLGYPYIVGISIGDIPEK